MSDDSTKQPDEGKLPRQSDQDQQHQSAASQRNQSAQNQQTQNQFQQQQQQILALPEMPALTVSQAPTAVDFFESYQPAPNVYDEVLDNAHRVRTHWRLLANEIGQIGTSGMNHRWKQIRRMIHQNGIAYSAYGDPSRREQHLQLDPLPQLITNLEWSRIRDALQQRAELLNLLLADLYGPRNLLTDGVLPPDILFNHPHYHLPFHGLPTPGGNHLHFYAAEIIRSPRGDWWIKADRTGSPGGSGFALENRIAISRAFPNAYRSCNVQRLAPYFIALRDHLTSLAKTNQENPHIAILTTGTRSSRYFEDSFLARYLGFTLVETSDLVVRSGRVMLKTLAGLAPIDVIFRRHQSNSIDPLELGGNSPGVPGILQVIREQNVVIANAPGSGLVESPIFMAFMPRICRALLGAELKLPGVATWWGGEPESFELMLERIDEIHLIPAYRERTLPGRKLTKSSSGKKSPKHLKPEAMTREERISLLRNDPTVWVGQERVARSSCAVWERDGLTPGYLSMRTYLTATDRNASALPGGLVRVSSSPHEALRNPFEGGGTKDVWVLSDKPVEPTSLMKSSKDPLEIVRGNDFLPSRLAENLCWLGRYLERADASARLLRAVVRRLTGETDPGEISELPALIRALASSGQIDSGYAIADLAGQLPALESTLTSSALNHHDPATLSFQIDRVVALAGSVRDRLSTDAWRMIQDVNSSLNNSDPANCDLVDLLDTIETLVVGLAAFSGFVSECMTRTHAFRFLNVGRRLEHGLQIISLVKNCFAHDETVSPSLMEAVLEISESRLTYRSRYYANLQLPTVLDLLLIDESNPRSLAYQLNKLIANLELLPSNSDDALQNGCQLARRTFKLVVERDIVEIGQSKEAGDHLPLADWLDDVEQVLPNVSTAVSNRFFVHSGPIHQLIVDSD